MCRLVNKVNTYRFNLTLKLSIIFAIAAIVTRIFYGWIIIAVMTSHGYSHCWPYSSPSIYARKVYVREEAYCIANSGVVRNDILTWIDQKQVNGQPLSIDAVQENVKRMLGTWDAE